MKASFGVTMNPSSPVANASPALEARGSRFGTFVLAAFLTAQVLDGVLTYCGVRAMGPAAEGNPLVAWLMSHLGEGPALAGTKLLAGTFGIALHLSSVHRIIAALTVFYLGAAILPWVKILFF